MGTKIYVKQEQGIFELIDGIGFVCTHEEAYLEPPCCDGGWEEGRYTCGCMGLYTVTCPTPDCTGIDEYDADRLLLRLL